MDYWIKKYPKRFTQNQTLLIHNCDTGFSWNDDCLPYDNDASMAVFEAEGDHWSFGLPDRDQPTQAIQIAEKKRISSLASIGLYGFSNVLEFQKAASWQLQNTSPYKNEYYIAPLLQTLIEKQKRVSLPRVKGVSLYGTPQELCKTFNLSQNELILNNQS